MKRFDAEILSNRELAPGWRELALSWEDEAGRPLAGQFLTLRVTGGYDPLLRRPFAFASFAEAGDASAGGASGASGAQGGAGRARASVIYQVRGKATRILSTAAAGATIDVLGPLGKGFPGAADLAGAGETPVLVAGGVGLGPVLYLAEELRRGGLKPLFLAGFRTASAIPRAGFPAGAVLCTDDGSEGFRGTPLDWLSHNAPSGRLRLMACGPSAMLAAVAALCRGRGWEASLSAEQWMACGVGACMGCALPARTGGFLRACADGPVFGRDAIDWEAEAARSRAQDPGTGTAGAGGAPAATATAKGGRE